MSDERKPITNSDSLSRRDALKRIATTTAGVAGAVVLANTPLFSLVSDSEGSETTPVGGGRYYYYDYY